MTIKEKYVAWRLEHQLHFVVRVGVDLHLHRVHVLVHIAFTDCDTYGSQNTTTSHQKRYDYFIQPQRYNYTSD